MSPGRAPSTRLWRPNGREDRKSLPAGQWSELVRQGIHSEAPAGSRGGGETSVCLAERAICLDVLLKREPSFSNWVPWAAEPTLADYPLRMIRLRARNASAAA